MHEQRADMARDPSPVKKSEAVGNAGRDEQMRVVGERVLLPARKLTRRRTDVEDWRDSPSGSTLDHLSRDLHAQERPHQDSHSPYHLPAGSMTTRAVVVNVASGADGWEDKFSTPKRGHMNGPASPTSAAPSFPRLPLDFPRPPLDHSKSSEVSTGTTSSSSSTQPSSSSLHNQSLVNQVRVVGERVLLPARKVTRRRAEPNADTETSPERGRTMSSSTRRSQIRSMHQAVSDVSDGPIDPGPLAFPASEAAHRDDGLTTPKAIPVEAVAVPHPVSRSTPSLSPSRPIVRAANPPETSTSTQSSVIPSSSAAHTSTGPVAPPLASQTSTSSVETNGRPPRRRKYSLLAAFGLPSVSRTGSEPDSSAPTPVQDAKVWTSPVSVTRIVWRVLVSVHYVGSG
ncbi:hypothetical protein C8Q80DRAFT_789363 [Daedaleopsis nitida]|nr:hypothetical protein C8Q80DRAFT_789363 [Daedaleopsis nitida]